MHTYMDTYIIYVLSHLLGRNFTSVIFLYIPWQGISHDLEIWCPNLLEISKQGVQIVHLQYLYMKWQMK